MISVTKWQQALRASDLPLATKGVLFTLSTYADWKTGEHVRPGKKLQDDCHISRTQAWEHIKRGLAAGWLYPTCHGSTAPKRNWANEYRLTLPEGAADHVRNPEQHVEGVQDHVRDSERDEPTMFGIPTDHVRESEPHLDMHSPINLPTHAAEAPSGEGQNRAKDNSLVEVTWDGDISRLVAPPHPEDVPSVYFVGPDGHARPPRGKPRPGEVRAVIDFPELERSGRIGWEARRDSDGTDRAKLGSDDIWHVI